MRNKIKIIDAKNIYFEKIIYQLKERTKKGYSRAIDLFIKFALEHRNKYLDDVSIEEVRTFLNELATSTSKQYANKVYSIVKSFYQKLSDYNYYQGIIPFKPYMLFKLEKKVKYYLQDNEIQRIINLYNRKIERSKDPFTYLRNKVIFLILLTSGLRCNECLNLKINDVDLKNKTILIRNTKTYKERLVPINQNILEEIKKYLEIRSLNNKWDTDSLFFSDKNKIYKYDSFRRSLYRIAIKLKINKNHKLFPHNLRHKFASDWIKYNSNMFKLKIILGHSSIKTTEIYVNISDADICEENKNGKIKNVSKYKY